ncbi:hypothetical protein HUO13_34850 [Saccharopolyspora erythraea]|uniref:WXG100 family type VII secretion target n=1 Tax=Saccharopolyspora erythraea TaxID=1836 RepID=UPI001BA81B71|nr:hypothetical protein [Saccharopolyspora erythraea]QUH05268.1 hypothetical protein HUO13_34850 [Saccharopolyspora erythraea]
MGAFADEEDPIALLEADPTKSNADALDAAVEDAGWQVQAVNWVYEKVTGENLIESLIAPITGDFSKIEVNAEAWGQVGEALSAIRTNLNAGISELRESWDGAGAVAFEGMLVGTWTVALEGDALLARLIGQGFQKAADMSRRMTGKALELIKKLVDRLIETAATGWIPVAGWANAVRQVERCVSIVMTIIELYEALTAMYEAVVALVDSIRSAGTNLSKIKEVNSLGDAVNLAIDIKGDATAVRDGVTGVRDSATQVRTSATETRGTISGGSGGSGGSSGGSSGSAGQNGSGYRTAAAGTL